MSVCNSQVCSLQSITFTNSITNVPSKSLVSPDTVNCPSFTENGIISSCATARPTLENISRLLTTVC